MKNNNKERHRARTLVMQALYQHRMAGTPANELEAQFIADNLDKKIEIDYFREVLREIFINREHLDDIIRAHIDREFSALDPISLSILRVAVYELEHRLDIPYRIVINESVELAKTFGATDSYKYINAVIDSIAKDIRKIEKAECQRNSN